MKTCKVCGEAFNEESYDGIVVNDGMDNEYYVCDGCVPSECNNGHIISCEACGAYFSAEMLHNEQINGQSFTACPVCGKDVVDCLTRDEFIEESKPDRYAVIVRYFNGYQRGYVVSVPIGSGKDVVKKLADKVDLAGVAEITVSQILFEEDEF